uniref:Uncharacterized protein n=1 Tax=Rhizophora mucronata TaxID=61149 RepID=A0A2P2N181_RHIMU
MVIAFMGKRNLTHYVYVQTMGSYVKHQLSSCSYTALLDFILQRQAYCLNSIFLHDLKSIIDIMV